VWVKRGDVHAETSADVVATKEAGVTDAIAEFARRGVSRVALQAHIAGPILKFYAVADGRFFSWYPADGRATGTWRSTRTACGNWSLPPRAR